MSAALLGGSGRHGRRRLCRLGPLDRLQHADRHPGAGVRSVDRAAHDAARCCTDNPRRGVLGRLPEVRPGDTLVLTTTRGRFSYAVIDVLTVPFDELTSTPAVVDVRHNTVMVITCAVAPDGSAYTGNHVVVGTLRDSQPN